MDGWTIRWKNGLAKNKTFLSNKNYKQNNKSGFLNTKGAAQALSYY